MVGGVYSNAKDKFSASQSQACPKVASGKEKKERERRLTLKGQTNL
jgi:hypothetical protein